MRVCDLRPGNRVASPGSAWIFIGQMPHPLYDGFRLVVWWKDDPETDRYSFDALSPQQVLPGEVEPWDQQKLKGNLKRALLPGTRSRG